MLNFFRIDDTDERSILVPAKHHPVCIRYGNDLVCGALQMNHLILLCEICWTDRTFDVRWPQRQLWPAWDDIKTSGPA